MRCNEFNRFTLHRLMAVLEHLPEPHPWHIARSYKQLIVAVGMSEQPLVMYSFMSTMWEETRDEIAALRKTRPDARIIAGGPHPSALPETVLAAGADTVFVGECELTFPAFWEEYVLGGKRDWPRIVVPDHPVVLDEVPPLARTGEWFAPTEITRGCAYQCNYCQTPHLFAHPPRHRTPAALAPWLAEQVDLGRRRFTALSPNALGFHAKGTQPNLDAIRELFAVCRGANIKDIIFGAYPGELRPEYVTAEAVALMREECSNNTVSIGAQAATDGLLQRANRGHTAAAVEEAACRLAEAGFIPIVDYVFGMPGETPEDRQAMLEQIHRLQPKTKMRVQGHYFLPLPGTPWMGEYPVEPELPFLDELRRLAKGGNVQGDWEKQRILARRMADWQRQVRSA